MVIKLKGSRQHGLRSKFIRVLIRGDQDTQRDTKDMHTEEKDHMRGHSKKTATCMSQKKASKWEKKNLLFKPKKKAVGIEFVSCLFGIYLNDYIVFSFV